ncbi:MAG: Spy/CpxP family protein refolding chaperone [Pseudomonadota bacterium]|nr:Spy/CpxP family protein refolding chaperone [Pseudomonadota bacterium]
MTRILFALLLLLPVLTLRADPAHRPPRGPRFTELAQALQLSDTQRASVKAIIDEQHQQMRALNRATREQRAAIRAAAHAKLATVLSAEQMQRLREFDAAHRPPQPGEDDRAAPSPSVRDAAETNR